MAEYVALLRGINVGGKNMISKQVLANCFREAGYENVRTHIQSGNVLFASVSPCGAGLEAALERMLQQHFGTPILTIVRSRDELAATIAAAPANHSSTELRNDVFFLKQPLTTAAVVAQMPELRESVDSIAPGPSAIYFSRTAAQASKTRITCLMGMPVFKRMTVRTWRTTTRLLELLDKN